MGVFPLTRNEHGVIRFKLQSPAMAYSLTVFIAIIVSFIIEININRSNQKTQFVNLIINRFISVTSW